VIGRSGIEGVARLAGASGGVNLKKRGGALADVTADEGCSGQILPYDRDGTPRVDSINLARD
jgi:hypothetical protein